MQNRVLNVIYVFMAVFLINGIYAILSVATVIKFSLDKDTLVHVFIVSSYFVIFGSGILIIVYKTSILEIYDFDIPDIMQLNSNKDVILIITKILLFISGFFIWAGAASVAPFFLAKWMFHVFGWIVHPQVWEVTFIPMACVGMFSATGVMKFLLGLR